MSCIAATSGLGGGGLRYEALVTPAAPWTTTILYGSGLWGSETTVFASVFETHLAPLPAFSMRLSDNELVQLGGSVQMYADTSEVHALSAGFAFGQTYTHVGAGECLRSDGSRPEQFHAHYAANCEALCSGSEKCIGYDERGYCVLYIDAGVAATGTNQSIGAHMLVASSTGDSCCSCYARQPSSVDSGSPHIAARSADGQRMIAALVTSPTGSAPCPLGLSQGILLQDVNGSSILLAEACVAAGGILNGDACCDGACGSCGGSGCAGRPGGAANCCVGLIRQSEVLCSGNGLLAPPCVVADCTIDVDECSHGPCPGGTHCVESSVDATIPLGSYECLITGEPRPTAAIPMENPHCSCRLTRVRFALQSAPAPRARTAPPAPTGPWTTRSASWRDPGSLC